MGHTKEIKPTLILSMFLGMSWTCLKKDPNIVVNLTSAFVQECLDCPIHQESPRTPPTTSPI